MITYGSQSIDRSDIKGVIKVLKSKNLTQGPFIQKFESELKKYFNCKHAVAVSSGTAALNLIVRALNLKKNDIVFVSPITFLSSANCILKVGAVPYFIDINMDDYSIDLEILEREIVKLKKKNKNPKAVIITDYAGHPANWPKLQKIKKKYGLKLINDNCHSIGSSINRNRGYATKYADFVALSFHPVKNITTGEGGAILTNKSNYEDLFKSLRSHGVVRNIKTVKKIGPWFYEMKYLGDNYRMSDIHASLGITQIKRLKLFLKKRMYIAKYYDKIFEKDDRFKIPNVKKNYKHSYHLYPLLINMKKINMSKKKIFSEFLKNKIKLQVHYIPINNQPYYKRNKIFNGSNLKNSKEFYKSQISLPIYFDLSLNNLKYIKKVCSKIFKL